MRTYQIEIQEVKSGKVNKMLVPGCGFTEGTIEMYATRMCDCNLAGYFHNEVKTDKRTGVSTSSPHNAIAGNWLANNKCDHSMPPKRFKALAVHLDGGEVVRLAS